MTYFLMITIVAISISFFYGLSWFFLNREMIVLSHRKQTLFKFLGIFILIQVLNNYILEFTPGLVSSLMNRNLLYLIEGPVFAVQALVLSTILARDAHINYLHALSSSLFSYFITGSLFTVVTTILYQILVPFPNLIPYTVLGGYVLTACVAFLISILFRISNFSDYFSKLFTSRRKSVIVTIVFWCIKDVFRIIYVYGTKSYSNASFVLGIIVVFEVILIILVISVLEHQRLILHTQRVHYLQQVQQAQSLERLTQEVRMLRHDFKNLFSSIYLAFDEGDETVLRILDQTERYMNHVDHPEPIQISHTPNDTSFVEVILNTLYELRFGLGISMFLVIGGIVILEVSGKNLGIYQYLEANRIHLILILSCLAIGSVVFLSFESVSKRIDATNSYIAEQNYYLNSLFKLQEGVRQSQKIYRDSFNQLAHQIESSGLAGGREYLRTNTLAVDHQLEKEVKQTAQLANIEIMEIKSLLLGKFIEMQGKKIDYVFECMNPIQTISMHSNDFIRAIGILIDNAIEAVEGHPTGYINVLLYQEDTYLKVVVENTIHEPIEINRIFSPDYSSKGSGRGLGLQSYRSILNKYRNAVGHTSCTNHKFKQELRVEG